MLLGYWVARITLLTWLCFMVWKGFVNLVILVNFGLFNFNSRALLLLLLIMPGISKFVRCIVVKWDSVVAVHSSCWVYVWISLIVVFFVFEAGFQGVVLGSKTAYRIWVQSHCAVGAQWGCVIGLHFIQDISLAALQVFLPFKLA